MDAFPNTRQTWIDDRLGDGDRDEVNRHVMQVYAEPLGIYFRGMPDRRELDAADAVNGFFADRLARPDFFADWQRSGRRLRRWLMTAFSLYLKEQRRARRRDGRVPVADPHDLDREAGAEAVDRAFAAAILAEAARQTRARCEADDLGLHWELFLRHYVHGQPYARLAAEYDLGERRMAVMVRTAASRFKLALRDLLQRDGVPEDEMEAEITALVALSG